MLNIQYKSIFMGDGLRYTVSAMNEETGEKFGRLLSLNESKYIHVLSNKDKIEYAKLMLNIDNRLTEAKNKIKIFDVIWMEGNIKHHQRIKASDERIAVNRIHSRGGAIVSLIQL